VLSGIVTVAVLAAPAEPDTAPQETVGHVTDTPAQVFADVLRQSIGWPARVDLNDQANVRLAEGLLIVPKQPAVRLLSALGQNAPADLAGLLLGPEGFDGHGKVRFVPAGFTDSDAALAWTADDMLSSLKATVERDNPGRVEASLPEREVRRWLWPPHYNPESHQMSWAALIVPKTAPTDTDGEVAYNGLGFGRNGYVQLTVVSSVQKAGAIEHMIDGFLSGLSFAPGNAYIDAVPTDLKARDGLAGAMGIYQLRPSEAADDFWSPDVAVAVVGTVVALIGAVSLLLSVQRHRRRESRRI
jgi:uncharacterized membrane-anchored protein